MKAKDLRNSILQLAVQGKLVPQDPNDEPASVLLERIRTERAKLVKAGKLKAPKGGESVIYRASDGSHYEKRGKGEPVCIDDEIPFEIPDNWVWCRFSSIAGFLNGDRSKNYPNRNEYVSKGMAWINTGHITSDGYLDTSTMNYITEAKYNSLSGGSIQAGDLVFCLRGATFGKIARVEPFERGAIASSLMIIRLADLRLREYVFVYLRSPLAYDELHKYDNGSAQPNLAAKDVEKYLVPIPPVEEQERIVTQIARLAPLIADYGAFESARERLDAELPDKLRKSILQLAVQGKLVEQDPADEPAYALLERIRSERAALVKAGKLKAPKGGESVICRSSDGGYYEKHGKGEAVCIDDEIPFEIPENWAWARIRDFGFFSSGKTPSKHDRSLYDGDHLWVTSKDMKSFKIAQTGITLSDKGAAGLNTYPVGTMLFVVRSGILKRFLPIALLDKPATINQDIKALTLYYPPIAVGLAYFIKAFEPYILEDLTKSVTTVDSLRFEEFQNMLIPIPPEAEWSRIVVHLDIALGDVITNQ